MIKKLNYNKIANFLLAISIIFFFIGVAVMTLVFYCCLTINGGHKCYIARPLYLILVIYFGAIPLLSYSYAPMFRISLGVRM